MWMIIAAIIIFVIFSNSGNKTSTTSKNKTTAPLHCTVSRTGSYSSILNQLEQIVFLIAKRCPWMTLQVLVMVRKINASTCSVSFQIEDVSLKRNNITFGSEFQDNGDGSYERMTFKTNQATGFTTPEAVKREMLLHFYCDCSVTCELPHGRFSMLYNFQKMVPALETRFTCFKRYRGIRQGPMPAWTLAHYSHKKRTKHAYSS